MNDTPSMDELSKKMVLGGVSKMGGRRIVQVTKVFQGCRKDHQYCWKH
jgi:hypothetical protein